MDLNLNDMVVLITGSDSNRFGTGFVIHKDHQATYLLTCAHVINDVGSDGQLKADYKPATLVASDPENGFDLAVLRVEEVLDRPLLPLKTSAAKDQAVVTAGFHRFGNQQLVQKITATLNEQGKVASPSLQSRTVCWHLRIEGEYPLEPGYSGAPIVDETTAHILGVVNKRKGEGEKGLAISIEALPEIWPDMPPELLVEAAVPTIPSVPNKQPQSSEPLMNLTSELAAFEQIAAHQDNETRLILVHGESGMGKTHLLKLYKQVAAANRLDLLDFGLASQLTIEDCLNQIVACFDLEHFPAYDEFCSAGPPESLTRQNEMHWQRTLTRKLFADLSKYPQAPRLAIFFDQHEKADPAFKDWLTQSFLAHISTRYPLIVVIAGQEDITPPSSTRNYRHFHLKGVTVDWYYDYVEKWQAPVEPYLIDNFHELLRGEPKRFTDYVKGRVQSGGGV